MSVEVSKILDLWAEGSPKDQEEIANETVDVDSIRKLIKLFESQPRLLHPLFFKTPIHMGLKFFTEKQALSNFKRNKDHWWFEEKFDEDYLNRIKALCKALEIQYDYFPYQKSGFTSLMVEMIYNLQIPFQFIYNHPNGLKGIMELNDDQIYPFLGLTKEQIVITANRYN